MAIHVEYDRAMMALDFALGNLEDEMATTPCCHVELAISSVKTATEALRARNVGRAKG